MDNISIGTVTFVVSERHTDKHIITGEEAEAITGHFQDYLQSLLNKKKLSEKVAITNVEWSTGCITIVVSLSIIGVAAGGYALKEFIKDYKEIREGVVQILHDLKNAQVWIRKKIKKEKQQPLLNENPMKKNDDTFNIMFQQAIDNYNNTDPALRDYWAAGQEFVVTKENGEESKYTLALKREDLKTPEKIKKPPLTKKTK